MMKLKEMTKLPKRAGLATLSFKKGISWPDHKGNVILLPKEPEAEFFPLKRGRQFLFLTPNFDNVVFAGTDENPFLVELNIKTLRILQKKGQRGFYEALKPEIIRMIEKKLGVASKRQGDIWAVPIPGSWHQIQFMAAILGLSAEKSISEVTTEVNGFSIFFTRHTLNGSLFNTADLAPNQWWPPDQTFAEGYH